MTLLSDEVITGDGRILTAEDVAQAYKDVVSLSVPSQGRIQRRSDTEFSLIGHFNTQDCDALETKKTFKAYALRTKTIPGVGRCIDSVSCITDAHDVGELAIAVSDNGRFIAKLKSSSRDSEKQLLEIWDRSRLLKTIDICESDLHGPINTDPQFSSFAWSKVGEQDKLLYVCQPKQPKTPPFFTQSSSSKSNLSRGEKFVKKESWGECLATIEHTLVAVLDVSNNFSISLIDTKGFSLAQSQWLDNDTKIVSVAHKEGSRRLGLIYCNNRPSKIIIHNWRTPDEDVIELDGQDSYVNVRVNNKGNQFLYSTCKLYGPHRHSTKMFLYDVATGSSQQLIDTKTKKDSFFIENLTANCFTSDDRSFILVISDYIHEHMCLFRLDKMELTYIKFPTTGMSLLSFKHDIILASGSEPNATPTLFVAALDLLNANDLVAWHQIEECVHLESISYETYKIPVDGGSSFASALLITPDPSLLQENIPLTKSKKLITDPRQLPTVVSIHGGPHTNFVVAYYAHAAFFARLGLKTLYINYRGSTGVDEDYLQVLNGRVGEIDIADCMQTLRHLIKEGQLNPDRLIVNGGSHSGFIACHLSCQDELKFTSAVIRNPVVDLASLHASSDIPEWSYNQGLNQQHYDPSWVPGVEEIKKLYECSPMTKVSKAHVPTLMLLGSQDLRVNMYQGERWVDALRARGVETLCKIYPDKHDLGKPETAVDALITIGIWILNHLPSLK